MDDSSPPAGERWSIADYGPIETLALSEGPVARPGPGEVLLAAEAVALNPLDLKIMSGRMKDIMPAKMPYVPGSDLVGRVVEAGPDAPAAPGERLVVSTWSGGAARRVLIPRDAQIARAPAEAPTTDLAALPMAGLTALHILRMLGPVDAAVVAIAGASGGVGLALTQLLSAAGAHVVGSARGPEDAALLVRNGARETVDYGEERFVDGLRRLRPQGVDALVDLVSMHEDLRASAGAVRDGGRLLSTLFGPEPEAFGGRVVMSYVRLKAERGDLERVLAAYVGGSFRANVERVFPFAATRAAYLALRDEHVRGKVVVAF